MARKETQSYTLEQLTDEYIGKRGTQKREQFEFNLKLDMLGDIVRKARKEQQLTQEQLGKLIGVQKAQISKIENNTKDVRFSSILRVFEALKAIVKMTIEFDPDSNMGIA